MKGLIFLFFLFLNLQGHSQTFELRLVNNGGGVLGVEMRETSGNPPTTANILTDLVFGICWQSTYGINLLSTSGNYTIQKAGPETNTPPIEYQRFAKDANPISFPVNWITNQWVSIMTIGNNMASSQTLGTFSVCPTNLQELNINYDLVDYPVTAAGDANGVLIGSSMPVELIAFGAVIKEDETVDLTWSTTNEHNFLHYDLEHSKDGTHFTSIAIIPARGVPNYLHKDRNPVQGTNYYRLKLMDKDGSYEYAAIETVEMERDNWRIFPNPTKSAFSVEVNSSLSTPVQIYIYDAASKLVYEDVLSVERGRNVFALNLPELIPGVYNIQLKWANGNTDALPLIMQK